MKKSAASAPSKSEVSLATGGDIAQAAAADFESFFHPNFPMRVRIKVGAVNHACIRKGMSGPEIVIPREMASEAIDSPERLYFHLLILGHEIGHLVHRHLTAGHQDAADYRSLEFWADFYGAKVMMTLLTYGERMVPVFRCFFPDEKIFPCALDPVGTAVGRLVKFVYTDDRRYPPKLLRAGTISNGITSFMRFHLKDADPIWPYSVFKRVISSPEVKELILCQPEDAEFDSDMIDRAIRWHRQAQGNEVALAAGMKRNLLPFLHTTFDQTDEEIARSQEIRLAELRAGGFDI
ncbi:MAG TPA: hypothetical protein VGB79_10540 [Allosphingosinicella sp.]|jgi:hypothetical protein